MNPRLSQKSSDASPLRNIVLLARKPEEFSGHWGVTFEVLSRELERAGFHVTLCAVSSAAPVKAASVVLALSGSKSGEHTLSELVKSVKPSAIYLYEGTLGDLSGLGELAEAFPGVDFFANLFFSTTALSLRSFDYRVLNRVVRRILPFRRQKISELPTKQDFPGNLKLTAETNLRAILAKSEGIPVEGAFQMFAKVPPIDLEKATVYSRTGESNNAHFLHCVILASKWQLRFPAVVSISDLFGVLFSTRVRRIWRFTIVGEGHGQVFRFFSRLLGITHESAPSNKDYANRIAAADLVWLPYTDFYSTQSSGKVADSLYLGKPVVSRAGTFVAEEMNRWLPGFPSYTSSATSREIFARWPSLRKPVEEALARQTDAIREYYSCNRLIEWLTNSSISANESMAGGPTHIPQRNERESR